jgi:iron(III) transport system ATP-binding protein
MHVKLENLKFKYDGMEDYFIDGFSLEIGEGEIIALLGDSGCGKSTILRILSGLEERVSGRIEIGGKTVLDERVFVEPERRNVGMVFQDYGLFPHMTVEQNVVYGLKGMSKLEKKARLKEVLELVNLKDVEKRYPHELSGGQQQRIALARAIAPKPKLLLMDEPFSNLDAALKKKIREELRSIIKSEGITSIIVTHDIEDADGTSDRIVNMN